MKVIGLIIVLVINLYAKNTINIITDRSDIHINDIIENYEQEYGIEINIFFTKKGLLQRAKVGDFDIVITKNSSEIVAAKKLGILERIPLSVLDNIPYQFRDSDQKWFNMSYRLRVFYIRKGYKNPPLTYEDLSDPQYRKQICVRKLTHNYNLEMLAMIRHSMSNDESFKEWFDGFKLNLARNPSGNDRNQVKGIYDNECSIAIANTYYMGLMLNDPIQKKWANSVDMIIPNQQTNGAISLYSGVGILKKNKSVYHFLNYLISDKTQRYLSSKHFEYTLKKENLTEDVKRYGKLQNINYEELRIQPNIQNDLFELRKETYRFIKLFK